MCIFLICANQCVHRFLSFGTSIVSAVTGGNLFWEEGFVEESKYPEYVIRNNLKNHFKSYMPIDDAKLTWKDDADWPEQPSARKTEELRKCIGGKEISESRNDIIRYIALCKSLAMCVLAHQVVNLVTLAGKRAGFDNGHLFSYGGHSTFASNNTTKHFMVVIYLFEGVLSCIKRSVLLKHAKDLFADFKSFLCFTNREKGTPKADMLGRIIHYFYRMTVTRIKDPHTQVCFF